MIWKEFPTGQKFDEEPRYPHWFHEVVEELYPPSSENVVINIHGEPHKSIKLMEKMRRVAKPFDPTYAIYSNEIPSVLINFDRKREGSQITSFYEGNQGLINLSKEIIYGLEESADAPAIPVFRDEDHFKAAQKARDQIDRLQRGAYHSAVGLFFANVDNTNPDTLRYMQDQIILPAFRGIERKRDERPGTLVVLSTKNPLEWGLRDFRSIKFDMAHAKLYSLEI